MAARKHGMARKAGMAPATLVHVGRDYGGEAKAPVLIWEEAMDEFNVREAINIVR